MNHSKLKRKQSLSNHLNFIFIQIKDFQETIRSH